MRQRPADQAALSDLSGRGPSAPWIAALMLGAAACVTSRPAATPPGSPEGPPEAGLTLLALPEQLSDASLEFSALATWPGHGVIMVPQYPDRFGDQLWTIPGDQLLAVEAGALSVAPGPLPVVGIQHATALSNYEGFEALAIAPDGTVAVLVEHRIDQRTVATLLQGTLSDSALTLGVGCSVTLEPPALEDNQSYEALLWDPQTGQWVAMPELNGPPLVSTPYFTAIDPRTCQTSRIDTVRVPWRITDVCAADDATADQLTTINYFWDGDDNLKVDVDPLAELQLPGATHRAAEHRERLVQWSREAADGSAEPSWRPEAALWLQLGERARNWEGIACLDSGWLLVTDRHPTTLLAFVRSSGRP
jgi:hypothetical protein